MCGAVLPLHREIVGLAPVMANIFEHGVQQIDQTLLCFVPSDLMTYPKEAWLAWMVFVYAPHLGPRADRDSLNALATEVAKPAWQLAHALKSRPNLLEAMRNWALGSGTALVQLTHTASGRRWEAVRWLSRSDNVSYCWDIAYGPSGTVEHRWCESSSSPVKVVCLTPSAGDAFRMLYLQVVLDALDLVPMVCVEDVAITVMVMLRSGALESQSTLQDAVLDACSRSPDFLRAFIRSSIPSVTPTYNAYSLLDRLIVAITPGSDPGCGKDVEATITLEGDASVRLGVSH